MFVIELIITTLIGLVVGSFLNVLIYRSREDKLSTIFFSRSYCPKCKHVLAWYDLFPLFSYLSLRGKCRYCNTRISLQYPVVEAINALVYIAIFFFFGLSLTSIFYALILSILLVVAVHDALTEYTPEVFVWIALVLSLFGSWLLGNATITSILLGGLIGAGVPGLLVLVSREKWMGAGDIKVGLTLGILLGYPQVILGMFLAFLIGAITGAIFIKVKNKTMKDSLPFAPFLIVSIFIALLYGEKIINWYLGIFAYGIGGR